MDESTPCPRCEYENPADNRFCGRCGTSLTSTKQLVTRRDESPATAVRSLPSKFGPTGKTLAVGLAALAAEAGVLWLRRRIEQTDRPPLSATQDAKPTISDHFISQGVEEMSVWLQQGEYQNHIFTRRVVRSFSAVRSMDRRR
jgi:hypothetical protein